MVFAKVNDPITGLPMSAAFAARAASVDILGADQGLSTFPSDELTLNYTLIRA
jgi:hypothetical protein